MADNITHMEQYRSLREEQLQIIKEIFRTEVWAAAGLGGLYSWLIGNEKLAPHPEYLWIGPIFVIICGLRCLALFIHLSRIAKYLKKLEQIAFEADKHKHKNEDFEGWNTYLGHNGGNLINIIFAIIIWGLMVVFTMFGSVHLNQLRNDTKPDNVKAVSSTNSDHAASP